MLFIELHSTNISGNSITPPDVQFFIIRQLYVICHWVANHFVVYCFLPVYAVYRQLAYGLNEVLNKRRKQSDLKSLVAIIGGFNKKSHILKMYKI